MGHESESNEDYGKETNNYNGTKSSNCWANFKVCGFEALMFFVQKLRSLSEAQQGPSLEIQVAFGALFTITHAIHTFKLRDSQNYKYYKRSPRFIGSKHSIWVLIHSHLQKKKYQHWMLFSANGHLNHKPIKNEAKNHFYFLTQHTIFLSQSLGFYSCSY